MHELSIALSIVEVAAAEASRYDGTTIRVHLKLGELSGVVLEALQSAWSMARVGTPIEEAELVVEQVAVAGYCPTCQTECDIISLQEFRCAACGTSINQVMRGRELEIVALEVET
jgi:hydrogenase nickel incorporation protein HypA/HybF